MDAEGTRHGAGSSAAVLDEEEDPVLETWMPCGDANRLGRGPAETAATERPPQNESEEDDRG